MTEKQYEHPLGHPQAVADGCTCPVLDNAHGQGCGYVDAAGYPLFIFNEDCKLHGEAPGMHPDEICYQLPVKDSE